MATYGPQTDKMNLPCGKLDSLRLSKYLSSKGTSRLQANVNRQAIHYNTDLGNAFSLLDGTFVLISGSIGDGVALYYGYGKDKESSDLDCVCVNTKLQVYKDENLPNLKNCNPSDTHAIQISDPNYAGYARLKIVNPSFEMAYNCKLINAEFWLSSHLFVNNLSWNVVQETKVDLQVHGPALNTDIPSLTAIDILDKYTLKTMRTYTSLSRTKTETGADKTDFVYCFQNSSWPSEADEWIVRERLSAWPKKELIQDIVKTGCLLAPVGHKASEFEDLQWRISFNRAELMLTGSFNETQMQCYILLKILNTELLKDISAGNITSYIMKQTIFWASESMPLEDWKTENMIPCFLKCISMLTGWVEKRNMPNYFIVKRNMFVLSELKDEVVTDIRNILDNVLENPLNVLFQSKVLEDCINMSFEDPEIDITYMDIINWMNCRTSMAKQFYLTGNQKLHEAYDHNSIQKSIRQSEIVLQLLSLYGGYCKPMIGLVENCLGVLHYAYSLTLAIQEIKDEERAIALRYFETSKDVDYRHVPLRMASCLIAEKKWKEALDVLDKYNKDIYEFFESHSDNYYNHVQNVFKHAIDNTLTVLKQQNNISSLEKIHKIAETDVQNQNLQETIHALRLLPEGENIADVLEAAWTMSDFDVIFMAVEAPVLPRPIQQESMIRKVNIEVHRQRNPCLYSVEIDKTFVLSYDPNILSCFLLFLCYFKMGGHDKDCRAYLAVLYKATELAEERHQVAGHNLMAYGCALFGWYKIAAHSVMKSLRKQPDHTNLAFHYLMMVYNALKQVDFDKDTNSDQETVIYQRTKYQT